MASVVSSTDAADNPAPQPERQTGHDRDIVCETSLQVKEHANTFRQDVWGTGVFAFNPVTMMLHRRLCRGGKNVWSGKVKPGGVKVVPWKIGRRNHRFDVIMQTAHGDDVVSLAAPTGAVLVQWVDLLLKTWPPTMQFVLAEAGLLRLLPELRDLGAESAEDFLSLTHEDLEELGLAGDECRRFFTVVSQLLSSPPKSYKPKVKSKVTPRPTAQLRPSRPAHAMAKHRTTAVPWNEQRLPTMERVLFLTETMHVLPKLIEMGAEVFEDLQSLTPMDYLDLEVTTPEMERIQNAMKRVHDGTFEELSKSEAFWNQPSGPAPDMPWVPKEPTAPTTPAANARRKFRASSAHGHDADATAAASRVSHMRSCGLLTPEQATLLLTEISVPNYHVIKVCNGDSEDDLIAHVEELSLESRAFLAVDGRRRTIDGSRRCNFAASKSAPGVEEDGPALAPPLAHGLSAGMFKSMSSVLETPTVGVLPLVPGNGERGILKHQSLSTGLACTPEESDKAGQPPTAPPMDQGEAAARASASETTRTPTPPPRKQVTFSMVRVRHFTCCIGAGVPCDDGPSLGLGWNWLPPLDDELTVDDAEELAARSGRLTAVDFAVEGHVLPEDRMDKLLVSGHRRSSVDLSTQQVSRAKRRGHSAARCDAHASSQNHLKRVQRRLSGLLPGGIDIIDGVDPAEAMKHDNEHESAMRLQPLLLGWFRTAARNSMVRNPSVYMSLSQRSTRLERSMKKLASI